MSNDNKSTIKISMVIAMFLLFFMLLQSATAVDITNSTAGGISKGISDTPNNGTLGLANGFYEVNNITIDKNLTIKGTSKSGTILNSNAPFNVLNGNTLTLYNLTINSNYLYTDEDIANYNNNIHNSNGSINGPGNVVFENCLFINNLQTDATVIVTASSTYDTRRANFTATVKDSTGNLLTGDVVFYVNNKFSGVVPIANGIASYNVDLANGNYVVHAAYIGHIYAGPWGNIIGQTSLINTNPKISRNQIAFNVNSTEIQLLSFPLPTSGNRYWVNPATGNDANPGTDPANPKRSILNAYNNALDNSYIILQPGTYDSSISGQVGISLSNKVNMTIIGNDTAGDVIIRPTSTFATVSSGTSANWRTINLYNMKIIGGSGNKLIIQDYNIANVDSLDFINVSGGRAIYAYQAAGQIILNVNNTQFINITISGSGTAVEMLGGAAGTGLYINNSNFVNLYGSTNGGVIRNNDITSYAPIEIYNSNFINCSASAHGGVFCINGPLLLIDNTTFSDCWSPSGGVIYSHSTSVTNITDSTFRNNRATTGNGAVIFNGVAFPINIDNCTFINNSAATNGAVIAASGGTITIKDSDFEDNRVTSQYGGAIGISGSATIGIDNSNFKNNSASSYGGAIGASGGTITINGSNFTDNYANSYGGAIGASSGTFTVNNSGFRGNYVSGSGVYGGALGTSTGTMNVYNSEFFNNSARNNSATANSYGGVAAVSGVGNINLKNCTVHGNWAKYGGAFGATAGNIRVNDSRIFNNYALDYGGAVGASGSGNIYVTNSSMNNNNATNYGGAVGSSGTGTIEVTSGSTMNNNRADGYGGAVGLSANGFINVYDSYMYDNIAVSFGGAVGATAGNITVRNSSLNRNKANGTNASNGYGGAVGLQSGTINVYDSEFINNTATTYGGAVGVPNQGTFYSNNSVFTQNIAGTYGGALGSGAAVNITYCNFTDNRAGTNGGAVAAMATSGVNSILSCQFEFNKAGTSGNAIYALNQLTANYNRFFNNSDISNPTNLNNTLWTNLGSSVNIEYNWWGDNYHTAVGNVPTTWVVVDVSTPPVLWNGTANYTYSIRLNTNASGFNVTRLPSFFGQANFTVPNHYDRFSAHLNGNIIMAQLDPSATQVGYFQVDNWIKTFNVTTNTTPDATNLTVNLGNTSGQYKDNVNLTATFLDSANYPIAGLNITFYINGVAVGSGLTNANGVAICPYTVGTAGPVNYTVTYNHTTNHNTTLYRNYNPINASTTLTFNRLNTNITVNGYVNGTGGTPIGLNVTIYDQFGRLVDQGVTIYFYQLNGPLYGSNITNNASQAILYYTFPTSGNYTWYAYFNGTGNYTASNSTSNTINGTGRAEISVILTNTTVNNASGVATVPVTINGTVYGANGLPLNGTVNITINGTSFHPNINVTDGRYNLTIVWNVSGSYTILVQYNGNGTYNRSNATGRLDIALMPTNTTVTNSSGTASTNTTITGTVFADNGVGINGTVNVTVTAPNGSSFTINNVNVTNGQYSLTVVLNSTGNYTVRAVYGGNLTYRNSSSPGAGFDGRIIITAMGSNATVNNPSSRATESVNINGTLRDPSGVNITGNVTVIVTGPSGTHTFNNVSVVNGQYNFNVTMNISGLYNITVNYLGDNTYGPSTARGVLNVSLMPTRVSVNNPTGNATLPVNINGTLLDDNGNRVNGTVNITVGGSTYVVNLTNGNYNLTVTLGANGTYPILVQYFGNGTYAGSINSTGNLYIAYMSSNTIVSNATGIATVPVIINGTVKDANGNNITGLVNITINGPGGPYTFNNVNVTNGAYTLNVTMGSEGIYNILVEYRGNGS